MAGWKSVYAVLCIFRLSTILYSPGYIHPDEWFQSTEAIAGDLLSMETVRTWEFDSVFPCRSMASILSANSPMLLLMWLSKYVNVPITTRSLLLVQRATYVGLSFVIDACLFSVLAHAYLREEIRQHQTRSLYRSLSLYASSGAALAFMPRAFSNCTEAVYLALTLWVTVKMLSDASNKQPPRKRDLAALGAILALGSFTRFTFPIFVAPSFALLAWTFWSAVYNETKSGETRSGSTSPSGRSLRLVIQAMTVLASAALVALLHVSVDSKYYSSKRIGDVLGKQSSSSFVIAPLNALLYNLRSDNLAEHGLHPRWLHFGVNAPMLLGVPAFVATLLTMSGLLHPGVARLASNSQKERAQALTDVVDWLLVATVLGPLAVLSIQPHQEPRFLLPLVPPSVALLARALERADSQRPSASRARKWSFAIGAHIAQGLLLAIFFGALHQGGLLPCLVQLNADLHRIADAHADDLAWWPTRFAPTSEVESTIELLFWRNFMPPRHLLLPALHGYNAPAIATVPRIEVRDLGSLAACGVRSLLLNPSSAGARNVVRLLVAPQWALQTLDLSTSPHPSFSDVQQTIVSLERVYAFGPHLDTDHVGESVALLREGMGVREALGLVVSRVVGGEAEEENVESMQ